jgi:steroid delta-isomerase-like uncharacterized protein
METKMNNKQLRTKTLLFLFTLLSSLLFTGCTNVNKTVANTDAHKSSKSESYSVSQEEYNKLVVMDYMEALSTSLMPSVADKILSKNYQELRKEFANMDYHAAGSELSALADPLQTAISHRRNRADAFIAEDDIVVVRYYITGTHSGNFYGIPATGKSFEIPAAAVFWLDHGKITKTWSMADEAGFLRQIGKPLPARADGRWEAWPDVLPARTGNEIMADALANPIDSQEYRNKLQLNAWKAPAYKTQILNPDQSQRKGLRSGFFNLLDAGTQSEIKNNPFLAAFPDRVDMITNLVADGKRAVIQFRLTATNNQSLFGIPAKGRPVSAVEFGFQEFDGEVWKFTWWFGDDLGMLLQIGGPQDYWFSNED